MVMCTVFRVFSFGLRSVCDVPQIYNLRYFTRQSSTEHENPERKSKKDEHKILETGERFAIANRKRLLKESFRMAYKGNAYEPVDLATSIDYMNSDAYKTTYMGKPVWYYYRRNFKGHFKPLRTRENCVFNHKLATSNACPICRDSYLLVHYQHVELLKQFINPVTLELISTSVTGVCVHQQDKLILEIEKAKDLGLLKIDLPFRLYNYRDYYDYLPKQQLDELIRLNESSYTNLNSDKNKQGFSIVDSELSHQCSSNLNENINSLPSNLKELMRPYVDIPHDSEFQIDYEQEMEIDKPTLPNRYVMEETYKKLAARRRKSRSLIFM